MARFFRIFYVLRLIFRWWLGHFFFFFTPFSTCWYGLSFPIFICWLRRYFISVIFITDSHFAMHSVLMRSSFRFDDIFCMFSCFMKRYSRCRHPRYLHHFLFFTVILRFFPWFSECSIVLADIIHIVFTSLYYWCIFFLLQGLHWRVRAALFDAVRCW